MTDSYEPGRQGNPAETARENKSLDSFDVPDSMPADPAWVDSLADGGPDSSDSSEGGTAEGE